MPSPIYRQFMAVLVLALMLHPSDLKGDTAPMLSPAPVDEANEADPAPLSEAPAFFGPRFEPVREITIPDVNTFGDFYPSRSVDLDGDTAFIVGTVEKANVWALLVWFWPEIALVVIALLSLLVAWRLRGAIKRPQVKGEPYCRKCNYRLTGSTAKNCPECGVELGEKNRIVGSRRNIKRAAIALLILLSLGGILAYRWLPLDNGNFGYGYGSDLPRHGAVSTWFDWPSQAAQEWVVGNDIAIEWTEQGGISYVQLWRANLRTGVIGECMYEYKMQGPVPPVLSPAPLRYGIDPTRIPVLNRPGDLRILRTGVERHLFDTKRGIYATIPYGEWDNDEGDWPEDVRLSPDGRYLFDASTFNTPAVWDTTTWKEPKLCPAPLFDGQYESEFIFARTIRFVPDSQTTVVEAIVRQLKPTRKEIFLWDPTTGQVRDLPEVIVDHDVDVIAFTHDKRFIVTEQEPSYPLIWDTQRIANGDDEPLQVPWREFNKYMKDQLPFVAAIAREGYVVYMYSGRYFAWHFDTNEVKPMSAPPVDAAVHWIATPETRKPNIWVAERGLEIEIHDDRTNKALDIIKTPVQVDTVGIFGHDRLAGPDDRLLFGQVGPDIVIYDRTTKKWIGRFSTDIQSTMFCNVLFNADATLFVVVAEDMPGVRLHVFELPALK